MTTLEYFKTPETVVPQELAYGEFRVAESPTVSHQRAVREVVEALTSHVRGRGLGEVLFAPMDVVLDHGAALVVQPDVMVISQERAHIVTSKVFGPPDLVVEVLSPRPRIGQLDERIEWFARYSVRECWLVRTTEREIEILTLGLAGVLDRTVYRETRRIVSVVLGGTEIAPLDIFGL